MLLQIVISLALHFEMDLSPPPTTGSIFSTALKFCFFFVRLHGFSWFYLPLF